MGRKITRVYDCPTDEQIQFMKDNINLVYSWVNQKRKQVCEDKDELLSIAQFAYLKAVIDFKPEYGIKFSYYFFVTADNELGVYWRSKMRHYPQGVSIDQFIYNNNGDRMLLEDIIVDNFSSEDDIILRLDLESEFNKLSKDNKKILKMKLNTPESQKNIAKELNMPQKYVAKVINQYIPELIGAVKNDLYS